jgi:glycerophosphoryl diester phosphodiesterase
VKLIWKVLLSTALLGHTEALTVEIIAHRGLSSAFQENTLPAITNAWETGATIVEIDIQRTADNQLIVFHDDLINEQPTATMTFLQIQALTPTYHVPSLQEVFEMCNTNQTLLLDLKTDSTAFVEQLTDLISKTPNAPQLQFQSRSLKTLASIRSRVPSPVLFLVSSLDYSPFWNKQPDAKKLTKLLTKNHLTGISAKGRQFIDRSFVETFQNNGLKFYIWTINSSERMEYYQQIGVDGIITDCPQRLQLHTKKPQRDT